jgi:hypothetical protein
MIFTESEIVKLFVEIDDFCKVFVPLWNKYLITNREKKYKDRIDTLSNSEIMTLCILYQISGYKDFKRFYHNLLPFLRDYFPNIPSYRRIFVLQRKIPILLLAFIQQQKGRETQIYYIDSTSLPVCKNQRIHRHKTFKSIAKRGVSSMGWFYGFKLHLIINDLGELINFKITKGNVFDNVPILELVSKIKLGGKLFGDKGYLCKEEVRNKLKDKYNIELITKSRKNMKNKQYNTLSEEDKKLLNKRGLIETVIGEMKRLTNIVTSKIKNVFNYLVNIFSSIATYQIKIKMGWR